MGVEEKLSQLHQFVLSSTKEDLSPIASFMHISTEDLNSFMNHPSLNETCQKTCQSLANAVAYYNAT